MRSYKLLNIFIIFIFCIHSNAEEIFYNYKNDLQFPVKKFSDYNKRDQSKLKLFLGYPNIRKHIPEDKLKDFWNARHEFERAKQIGRVVKIKSTKDHLDETAKDIINKLQKINSDNPKLFLPLKEHMEFAHSPKELPDGTPSFCQFFPSVNKSNKKFFQGIDKGEHIYKKCHTQLLVDPTINDLLTHFDDISTQDYKNHEHKALDYMLSTISKELLGQMSLYEGLFGITHPKSKLKSCINKNKDKKAYYKSMTDSLGVNSKKDKALDKIKSDNFIHFQKRQGLMAQSLFKLRKDSKNKLERLKEKNKGKSRRCARTNRLTGMTCKEFRSQFGKQKRAIELEIERVNKSLAQMMKSNPVLFEITNSQNFKKLSFVNVEISPSPLLVEISKANTTDKVVKSLTESLNKGASWEDAFSKVKKNDLRNFSDSFNQNSDIRSKAQEQVKKHLMQVNQSLVKMCEEEGKDLHHYQNAFPDTFSDISKNTNATKEILETQAGLCSLYERRLPNDGHGVKYYAGLALIGTGSVIGTVGSWTGVGALIGGGLVLGGGSLSISSAIDKFTKKHNKSKYESGLAFSSWSDINNRVEARSNELKAIGALGVETMMIVPDMVGMGLATKGVKAIKLMGASKSQLKTEALHRSPGDLPLIGEQRVNSTQRKSINDIDKKLSSFHKPLLIMYLDPSLKLKHADETYFVAMAKVLEDKYLSEGLSRRAVERKVKKELDSILNKCNKVKP